MVDSNIYFPHLFKGNLSNHPFTYYGQKPFIIIYISILCQGVVLPFMWEALKLVTIHPDPTWCRYMYVFVCINIGGKNTHRPCPNPSPATSEPPFQSSFHLMTMTWGPLNMFIWNYGVVSTWSSQKYRFPHQILYLIFFSSSMWGTQYMPYFFPFSSHYMYTHYLPCRIVLCVTDF